MDPVTRRLMWSAIDSHKAGRCLLLTTHSMEEAEAVSDSIGIIAHGELQCIGSVQHLRDKFNNNYHLSIDLKPEAQIDGTAELVKSIVGDQSPPQNAIPTMTPPAPGSLHGPQWSLVESVGSRRTYELNVVPSMSELFRRMETNKDRFFIQSYSLTQASLEDIFLQLVRREEMEQEVVPVAKVVQPAYNPNMGNAATMPYSAGAPNTVAYVAPGVNPAYPTTTTTTTTTYPTAYPTASVAPMTTTAPMTVTTTAPMTDGATVVSVPSAPLPPEGSQ